MEFTTIFNLDTHNPWLCVAVTNGNVGVVLNESYNRVVQELVLNPDIMIYLKVILYSISFY